MATLVNNCFTFGAYTSPIIGAYIADQYWGKFRTIITFALVYCLGFFILTFSAIPASYDENGVPSFSSSSFPLFVTAIAIIALGTGGIKALVSPMCADQISKSPYKFMKTNYSFPLIWKKRWGLWYLGRTETQEECIADPDLTIQSVYNWFYWSINVGAILGSVLCTRLEQDMFWKAYLLPSCMFVLAIVVVAAGYRYYVHVPPEGSIYKKAYLATSYSLAKRMKEGKVVDADVGSSFTFLEYAKRAPESESKWYATFPGELQQAFKACSIFPLMTFYWVAYNQMTNNLISQAGQMNRPDWLTNDVVNNIDPIVLILLIPLFDWVIYPGMAKRGIEFGYIKRITLGIFIGGLSMVVAAICQYFIYHDSLWIETETISNVSVYWQIFAYSLIAISEIFASIGSLEYSYTHAPESMKGIVSALSLFPNAAASVLFRYIQPTLK